MLPSVRQVWNRITEPLVNIEDAEARRQAQIIASLAVVVLIVCFIGSLVIIPLTWGGEIAWALPILAGCLLFIIPYVLSRRGHLRAATLATAMLGVYNTAATAVILGSARGLNHLQFLVVAYIFAATFLSFTTTVLLAAAVCLGALLAGPALFGVGVQDVMRDVIPFHVFVPAFLLIFAHYWRQRESSRRAALEQSEARHRMMSELTSDYLVYYRVEPNRPPVRTWTTEAYERITGYSPDDFDGRYPDHMFFPEDLLHVNAERDRVLRGERTQGQWRIIRKDGVVRWLRIQRVPDFDANGRMVGYYGAVVDVTDHVRAEEQRHNLRLRREQWSLMRQFVSAVSHDFRTRLATIETSRYLVDRLLDQQHYARAQARLATIEHETKAITQQLSNLMMVTSLAEPRPTSTDLNGVIGAMVNRYTLRAHSQGATLQADVCPDALTAYVDAGQIEEALSQLLDNALAHTPSGGQVTIRARAAHDSALIEVADTGAGIPLDKQEQVFQPFFRSDEARTASLGGVGVGLTLVKMIVDAHRGKIALTSVPGEGTCVQLMLPDGGVRDTL
jgi:PAS domain S-box-containing protein